MYIQLNGFRGVEWQAWLKEDQYLDADMRAMGANGPRPWKEQTS